MSRMMNRVKRWTAGILRAWATRLDPAPSAKRTGSGWTIEFSGVPLAEINTGMVNDMRGHTHAW